MVISSTKNGTILKLICDWRKVIKILKQCQVFRLLNHIISRKRLILLIFIFYAVAWFTDGGRHRQRQQAVAVRKICLLFLLSLCNKNCEFFYTACAKTTKTVLVFTLLPLILIERNSGKQVPTIGNKLGTVHYWQTTARRWPKVATRW